MQRKWKRGAGAVAACLVLVVGTLNISPTVAAAAADVPVLGGLFQILTVRSYQDTNEDRTVEVEQPGLSGGALAQQVSEEIQERVDAKIAEGEEIIAQYKEAFLATGGTEEQWAEKDNTVSVTYDIKSQTDTTVSFVVDSYVSIANAYQEQVYYNLDLAENREITPGGSAGGELGGDLQREHPHPDGRERGPRLCSSLRTWVALPRWMRPRPSISTRRAILWWCSPSTLWLSVPWAMWNLRSASKSDCKRQSACGMPGIPQALIFGA